MTAETKSFQRVRYEVVGTDVARVTLARPDKANAQDYRMLSELNTALDDAARNPAIKVIIVAADGKHFSSGHDLSDLFPDMSEFPMVGTAANFDATGAEGLMDREREAYLGYCRRWREIPKPTIAQVQGRVIAGGLMLMWPMDLIVCSDDATFCDPVLLLGSNGVQYFAHPYEVGFRLAKDMLFTGRTLTAAEAHQVGMVQRVFSRVDLADETLALAVEIAKRPAIALATAKRAVNFAQDAMGLQQTLDATFAMHHVLDAHNMALYGDLTPPEGPEAVRQLLQK